MVPLTRSLMQRYGVAVLAVGSALLLMLLLNSWVTMTQTPFLMFFGAVVVSGWYGGMKPGLLATCLSALLSAYFFLAPTLTRTLNLENTLWLFVFVLEGVLISVLCGALRTANQRLEVRQIETDLQEANRRITNILESITDAFISLDTKWQFTYVNPHAEELLGKTQEELLGRTVSELFPAFIGSQLYTQVHNAITEQVTIAYEDFYPALDKWFAIRIYPSPEGVLIYSQDITEHKREEALREEAVCLQNQQKWLEAVLNFLPSPLLLIEPETARVTFANKAADNVAGGEFPKNKPAQEYHSVYYCTDAKGQRIPDDQMPGVRVARGERLEGFEMDWHTIGGVRSLIVFADTLPPMHGYLATCVLVFQDITARKRLENELRQSEARFRRLVESNIIGVFFPDLEGNISDANDAFLQIVGYNREELRRGELNWKIMSPPEYQALDELKVEELKTIGVCVPFEKEYIRKDGSRVPLLLGAALLEESQPNTVAFAIDLSDRKQMIESLQESEERFRNMADTAPVLIWMSGTDKLCNYFNKGWLDFTGRAIEEEMGNGWAEGVHPDDCQRCVDTYESAFDVRQEFKMEYRRRRFDGEYRWVFDTGIPRFTPDGSFLGYIGSCMDISDRVFAEAEIRRLNESLEQRVKERTAQLEAANQELESFSYSVSHDLRAPLRHISGFVDLLQKEASATLNPTSLRYLNTIAQSTQQAGKLIDDLLTFSRMGRAQMRYATIDMNLLVKDVQRELERETNGRIIHWHVEELPEVQGDASLLRQVLRNLMENALKYTGYCDQAEITIGSTQSDREFIFFVRDNGVGFDMRYVHKLFGVFQRLHSSQEFEGTGIGLANVQRIIHRHGGRTWAEGVVNVGATFYFSLPKIA
ncbi:MAG TPA: PAS domain S-box protein [Coleofasciculaceae cyanobacterium]